MNDKMTVGDAQACLMAFYESDGNNHSIARLIENNRIAFSVALNMTVMELGIESEAPYLLFEMLSAKGVKL